MLKVNVVDNSVFYTDMTVIDIEMALGGSASIFLFDPDQTDPDTGAIISLGVVAHHVRPSAVAHYTEL